MWVKTSEDGMLNLAYAERVFVENCYDEWWVCARQGERVILIAGVKDCKLAHGLLDQIWQQMRSGTYCFDIIDYMMEKEEKE